MKVWIRYTIFGWSDSQAYKDEVEFRHSILGPNHWSSISMAGPERYITLQEDEDIATIFALKYANCRLDKVDTTAT